MARTGRFILKFGAEKGFIMRIAPLILGFAGLCFLAGCQSAPNRVPDPGPPQASKEPDDRKYTVTYRGSSADSSERVRDLALLRAATITLQKGGSWFEVVTEFARNQEERTPNFEIDPFSEAGTSRGDCGVLGCPSNADPSRLGKRDRDPQTFKRKFNSHAFEIIVNDGETPFYKENAYDALEISDEIRRKYSTE